MNKIALIDLDNTLADYDKAMSTEMAKLSSPNEPPYTRNKDEPYIAARRRLIRNQTGFWKNLDILPLGFDVVNELCEIGYCLNILTQGPRKSINAWSEKAEFCQKYLPGVDITITQNKSLSYGRVLVDDYPLYFLNWLEHRPRGLVVCIAHPWNEEFSKGNIAFRENIFRYDGTNREELKIKLKEAYNR